MPDFLDGTLNNLSLLTSKVTIDGLQITQQLGTGTNKRLRWRGYTINAFAGQTTSLDIVFTEDIYLQGGHFYAGESKTGDSLSFILAPGIPGVEFTYVDAIKITKNGTYEIFEDFSTSSKIPVGIPIRISYTNSDIVDKVINIELIYRID